MKFLIIGSTGFLGRNLCRHFKNENLDVYGLSREAMDLPGVNNKVSKVENYPSIIKELNPNYIINTAAIASHERCIAHPKEAEKINSLLAGELSKAARENGSYFVQISSDAVYEGNEKKYSSEEDETVPQSIYGKTKLKGERLVIEENENALVVRTNFFGWSYKSKKGILDFFTNALERREQVIGYEDYKVSSIYISEAAKILYELAKKETKGIVNLGSCSAMSKYEFGRIVARESGHEDKYIKKGSKKKDFNLKDRKDYLGMDVSRIESLIGRRMESTEAGIKRAFEERWSIMKEFMN